jgi:hypothetical protein
MLFQLHFINLLKTLYTLKIKLQQSLSDSKKVQKFELPLCNQIFFAPVPYMYFIIYIYVRIANCLI